MDNRYRNYDLDEDNIEAQRFSDDHPIYDDLSDREIVVEDDAEAKVNIGDHKVSQAEVEEERKSDEELNINPTPKYSSFEQIKKELVVLDLERQIAWEELQSLKYEFKEDLSPSNFVPPILGTVGVISGLVILKNVIFGK